MQKRTKFAILDEIAHHKKTLKDLETELKDKNNVVEVIGESPIQPTTKRLKIKFWKAEKAVVMQILEQEGLPKNKEEGIVQIGTTPSVYKYNIFLRGGYHSDDLYTSTLYFHSNSERDEYLNKITNAITDELFSNGAAELKVGDMCEVSSCPNGHWRKKKLIAILPDNYRSRFITQCDDDGNDWFGYTYAQPISKRIEPKVEECGEIITYTWEE